ncbi:hypothetical protein LTR56_014400 [Elasticomyces elasticus]|nr:hypothetical protein LTR22_020553 [Elasticomyces elasticus]KAK3636024.1 hypothetical protein LTR56_014400 [Elasticomyces elasticus]KAK4916667.1 hypothetical protein LTR49_015365 [Elasticomyces elasticus]KAK5754941.1 hypothetical protein LTS12_014974 [Elasticomyces elasticus]
MATSRTACVDQPKAVPQDVIGRSHPSLLGLPRELRDLIYTVLFTTTLGTITVDARRNRVTLPSSANITRTCAKIRDETIQLLFTLNSVVIDTSHLDFLELLGDPMPELLEPDGSICIGSDEEDVGGHEHARNWLRHGGLQLLLAAAVRTLIIDGGTVSEGHGVCDAAAWYASVEDLAQLLHAHGIACTLRVREIEFSDTRFRRAGIVPPFVPRTFELPLYTRDAAAATYLRLTN